MVTKISRFVQDRIVHKVRDRLVAICFVLGLCATVGTIALAVVSILSELKSTEKLLSQSTWKAQAQQFFTELGTANGRFLRGNLRELAPPSRILVPLESDVTYFRSLQTSKGSVEEDINSPPDACFVLLNVATQVNGTDQGVACTYVTRDANPGRWINLFFRLPVQTLTTHKIGTAIVEADRMRLKFGSSVDSLDIVFQEPPPRTPPSQYRRFSIAGYFSNPASNPETRLLAGTRIQGWAALLEKPSARSSSELQITLRLHYEELIGIIPGLSEVDAWPLTPSQRGKIVLRAKWLGRGEIDTSNEVATESMSLVSVASLMQRIFDRSDMKLCENRCDSGAEIWSSASVVNQSDSIRPDTITFIDRWIDRAFSNEVSGALRESSRGLEIEVVPRIQTREATRIATKWIASVIVLLLFFVIVAGIWVVYPLQRLASWAEGSTLPKAAKARDLPYVSRWGEIGALARSFRILIRRSELESQNALIEARKRDAELIRERSDAIRLQYELLRHIGHEIRSPLQALLSVHKPGTPNYRYVGRMKKVLDMLQDAGSFQESLADLTLTLESGDLVSLANAAVENASRRISDVVLVDSCESAICEFDPERMEDSIDHILNNAERFRKSGTAIELRVETSDAQCQLVIRNYGSTIPPERLEAIFLNGASWGDSKSRGNLGQGLFVVKQYIGRMNGHAFARNTDNGVEIVLILPLTAI